MEMEPPEGGSTDVAEVTRLAPGVSIYVATAGLNLPWHSWSTAASHGRPNAARGASVAAKVLAMTAIDFLLDEDLLKRAKAEFDEKMKDHPYVSPIPKGQKTNFARKLIRLFTRIGHIKVFFPKTRYIKPPLLTVVRHSSGEHPNSSLGRKQL